VNPGAREGWAVAASYLIYGNGNICPVYSHQMAPVYMIYWL